MKVFALIVFGIGMGLAAGVAVAQSADEHFFSGAAASHRIQEKFDMSVGITGSRRPARPTRLYTTRQQMNVPDFYGSLIGMTGDAVKTVFWYRGADNAIRNVVIDAPGDTLYSISVTPVLSLEFEPIR